MGSSQEKSIQGVHLRRMHQWESTMGSIQGGRSRALHPKGPFKCNHEKRHLGHQAWLSGVQMPPLSLLFPAGQLPAGWWEATRRNLLAVQLQLDNGTALPTNATVWLRWRMLTPGPAPEGYVVLYRCLLPASTAWSQQDVGRELSTIIPALKRGYQYEFKVRPYAGGTQGLDSNSWHLWIPEEVPSAAPQRVTVGQAAPGNGTVIVSWEPPPPDAHNGIIRGYQV